MADIFFDRRAIPAGARLSEWQASDGWRLRRLDWRQPKGKARGRLLFAGGRGDFIEKYLEVDAHFFGRGWDVTSFDWRGQGGSRGSIEGGHLDSLDPLVDDLAGLIEAWRGEGPGPYVAIGHSMGGHVLLRGLAERRLGLDAAVLVAPMVAINSAPVPAWSAALTASAMTLAELGRHPAWHQSEPPPPPGSSRQAWLTGCRDRYGDELWWWKKEPGFNLAAPSWGWLNAAYRSSARLTDERLRGVKTPVLLLGAEHDRLVSAPAIRRAAGLILGAELEMFANSAHEILRERDSVRLRALARIDAFLEARTSG